MLEAAYWLLHAEGSEASWQLRDRLPSWKRETDEPRRPETEEIEGAGEPMEIARRIGSKALDPTCQIELNANERLQNAHLTIELPDTGQTCEGDLDLRAIEPAMAAFAPAALADFWLRTIGNSLADPESFLNRLPEQLEDCFLLLPPELIERVSGFQKKIDGNKELEIQTELQLTGVLLASKDCTEDQADLLLRRINEFDER